MASRKDTNRITLRKGEYQRKNGTYEAKITVNGVRYSVSAKTLNELRQKESEFKIDDAKGLKLDKNSITIAKLFDEWISAKRGIKATTKNQYLYAYQEYIDEPLGSVRVKDLDYANIKLFFNAMADNCYKISTIEHVYAVLHQILDLAVRNKYISYNPSNGTITELHREPAIQSREVVTLTSDQLQEFERYLANESCRFHRFYPFIYVMLHLGLRIGETMALTWSNIDFDRNEASIKYTLNRNYVNGKKCVLNTPKTQSSRRTIPITEDVKQVLQMEKAYQRTNGIKCRICLDGHSDFVFLTERGNLWATSYVNRKLAEMVDDYNREATKQNLPLLPRFSSHTFRHSCASRLNESGKMSLKAIQKFLGHQKIDETVKTYIDASPEQVRSEYYNAESGFATKEKAHITSIA